MLVWIGLGSVGALVVVCVVVGLISSRRKRQRAAQREHPPAGVRGETVAFPRHQTGTDWRYRPE